MIRFLVILLYTLFATNVLAQNTSGVFGPIVKKGDKTIQYRAAHDPDTHGFSNRIHYQQAIDDQFRLRFILAAKKTDDHTFDISHGQVELVQQLTKDDSADYQTALRYDVRVATNNRPGKIGLDWTNQYNFTNKLSSRAVFITAREFGENAEMGYELETRFNLAYKINSSILTAIEVFNEFGTTKEVPTFKQQTHQVGPSVGFKFDKKWKLYTGVLFGVTNESPDKELRSWVTKSF